MHEKTEAEDVHKLKNTHAQAKMITRTERAGMSKECVFACVV